MIKQFYFKQSRLNQYSFFVDTQLDVKTILFETIHLNVSTRFSSIWSIDRTLSSATIPSQSRPGSDGIEQVLCIPQSSSITKLSPSDSLASYLGHSLGSLTFFQRWSQCILQP